MKNEDRLLRLEATRLACVSGKLDLDLAAKIYLFLKEGKVAAQVPAPAPVPVGEKK